MSEVACTNSGCWSILSQFLPWIWVFTIAAVAQLEHKIKANGSPTPSASAVRPAKTWAAQRNPIADNQIRSAVRLVTSGGPTGTGCPRHGVSRGNVLPPLQEPHTMVHHERQREITRSRQRVPKSTNFGGLLGAGQKRSTHSLCLGLSR